MTMCQSKKVCSHFKPTKNCHVLSSYVDTYDSKARKVKCYKKQPTEERPVVLGYFWGGVVKVFTPQKPPNPSRKH
eukprot:923182-Amphidinium_carterae.1